MFRSSGLPVVAALAVLVAPARGKDPSLYSCEELARTTCANPDAVVVATVGDMPIVSDDITFRRRRLCEGVWDEARNEYQCNATEEEVDFFGPTLQIDRSRGRYTLLLKNDMYNASLDIGPSPPTKEQWFELAVAANSRYAGLQSCGFEFVGPEPASPEEMCVVNAEDRPKLFDRLNLHFHGMQIMPHLFEPMGTSNPDSEMIGVDPGECFCYNFAVPTDHPTGTYFYHPHYHDSVATQMWSGMFGLVFIVEGEPKSDLPATPFVIWDPHLRNLTADGSVLTSKDAMMTTDYFLHAQTDQSLVLFLVNGGLRPEFSLTANEAARFAVLCATTENLAGFAIVPVDSGADETDSVTRTYVPFQRVAADGIDLEQPLWSTFLVMGGGQREDVLLNFSQPGRYAVVSEGLSELQFFCTGPDDAVLAYINVLPEEPGHSALTASSTLLQEQEQQPPMHQRGMSNFLAPRSSSAAPMPRAKLRAPVLDEEVVRQRNITMSLAMNVSRIPFPQMMINEREYNMSFIEFELQRGQPEEWLLLNPEKAMHPFHVHETPFQVMEVVSDYMPEDPSMAFLRNNITGMWRDTVIVPPLGSVRIRIRFENETMYAGKSVLHCHFLAHEDTGMIANYILH